MKVKKYIFSEFLFQLNHRQKPEVCPFHFSQEHWIGGYVKDGKEVRAADTVKSVFDPHFDLVESLDMPWIIRMTARLHQVTFGHATVWRRKSF